jgi:hypothetical protein
MKRESGYKGRGNDVQDDSTNEIGVVRCRFYHLNQF